VQFEVGAAEVLVGLKSKVAGEDGEMEEPGTGDVQVLLTSKENAVEIRTLAVFTMTLLFKSCSLLFALSEIFFSSTVHIKQQDFPIC